MSEMPDPIPEVTPTPEATPAAVEAEVAKAEAQVANGESQPVDNVDDAVPVVKSEKKPIKLQVAEKLANAGEEIENRVVDMLYEQELTKRTGVIEKLVNKIDELEKEAKKIAKFDVGHFDGEGKEVLVGYSKERSEARKKNTEQLGKLKAAVTNALEKGDWSKANELAK